MSNRLIFEGKIYRLKWNNVERSTKYWSCLFPGCNGTIVEKNGQLIPGRPHSEDCSSPERSEMEAKSLFWGFISTELRKLENKSVDIYNEAVKKITEKINGKNEKFEIPPQQEVLSYISHKRKKIFPYDHLRIVSSYPYSKTKDGYQFWRFTSEILISGKKEIAMFWFSDFVSRPLLEANQLFLDGTFLSAADPFKQLVSLMVYDTRCRMYIPTHYIALTDNSKNLYKYALNFLFTFLLQNQIKLSYITCDFEWTLQQALKETIPQAKIVGCFFHFKKAVQAKLMKFAPTPTEEEKQIIMEEIETLTFIPPEEIEGKVQELANKFSKFSKFFQYFRTTWLKKYGHSRWNIHSYPNLWERTNNPLEGYHKKLNSILKHEKPNICKMAELLINEEDYYRRKMMENLNQWSNHPVDEKREETKQWMNRMKVYLDQRKEKSNLQMTNENQDQSSQFAENQIQFEQEKNQNKQNNENNENNQIEIDLENMDSEDYPNNSNISFQEDHSFSNENTPNKNILNSQNQSEIQIEQSSEETSLIELDNSPSQIHSNSNSNFEQPEISQSQENKNQRDTSSQSKKRKKSMRNFDQEMTNSQRNKPSPSQEKRQFHCSLCGSPYHTKKKCSLNPQNK